MKRQAIPEALLYALSYDATRSRRKRIRSAGKRDVGPRSVSLKELGKIVRRHLTVLPPAEESRPITRADCIDGPRPCPWVSCRHHLFLEVDEQTGSLKLNFPDLEPDQLPASCSLDVADAGAASPWKAGELMNLTRWRVRQLERAAIARLRRTAGRS